MTPHTPKEKGEHIEDYIERRAATDSHYAIAHAILVHGRGLEDAISKASDLNHEALTFVSHGLRDTAAALDGRNSIAAALTPDEG